MILFVPTEGNNCVDLLSSTVDDNEYALTNPEEVTTGFTMETKDTTDAYQVQLVCNKETKTPTYQYGNNGLTITSRTACGHINVPARLFMNNKIVFSLVFMVIGLIFMIFGGWKWDKLLSGVGFLAGLSFVFFVFWAFVDYDPSTTSYVIISIVAVIVGLIVGYICHLFDFVSYFCVGFFGSYLLVRFLFVTFPIRSMQEWVTTMLTYIIAVVVGVICIFVGKYFMVIITAIVGSFVFWYNFGFLIGVLPNMFDFFEKFKTFGKFSAVNIVFLVIIVISSVGFIVLQYKLMRRSKKKNDAETRSNDRFEEQFLNA